MRSPAFNGRYMMRKGKRRRQRRKPNRLRQLATLMVRAKVAMVLNLCSLRCPSARQQSRMVSARRRMIKMRQAKASGRKSNRNEIRGRSRSATKSAIRSERRSMDLQVPVLPTPRLMGKRVRTLLTRQWTSTRRGPQKRIPICMFNGLPTNQYLLCSDPNHCPRSSSS